MAEFQFPWKTVSCCAAAAIFVTAGTLHFLKPEPFLRIMPPPIPYPLAMVYVSGACEIAGGLGLLHPLTRRAAGRGLCALLLAVFPANVYMATSGVRFGGFVDTPLYTAIRLPLQFLAIGWIWWASEARGPGCPD